MGKKLSPEKKDKKIECREVKKNMREEKKDNGKKGTAVLRLERCNALLPSLSLCSHCGPWDQLK